jgi:hypothetical protein
VAKLTFKTKDNILVMDRTIDPTLDYDKDKLFLAYVLKADSRQKGVKVLSYKFLDDKSIEAIVEWL